MWKETRTSRVLKPLQAIVSILLTWEGKNTVLRDSLEKEVATHSSVLAWRILWAEEPGGLLFIGSHRAGHDWSDFACMHALEKEVATHSSVLAWRIPGTEEPGGLPSMGSHSWTWLKRLSSSSRDSQVAQWQRTHLPIHLPGDMGSIPCPERSHMLWSN